MAYDLRNGQFPFPLNYLPSDGGEDLTPFVAGDKSLALPSENWYVLCLTPQEMIDLQSVVAIGAPLLDGTNFNVMIQKYNQMIEFPNQIPEGSCMDLCQLMLDCIDTTPALQQAIANYSVGSPISNTSGIDTGTAGKNVLIENVGCADDNLFGMTTGLVDLYNNLALDIIEQLSASANTMGRLGDAIEAIPVVGELPVDDALQFVESFLDDIEQNYQASYTVAVRDDYRCDLFCIAQDGCELTFTDIFDYFNAQLVTSVILIDFQDLVEYMTNGLFSGVELVHAFHAFVAGVFMLGGNMIGIDSAKLIQMVSALFNDPDADWATLCLGCLTWEQTFDFAIDSYAVDGWAQAGWGDGYIALNGWRSQGNGSNQEVNYLELVTGSNMTITYMEVWVENKLGTQTTYGSDPGWQPNISMNSYLLGVGTQRYFRNLGSQPTTYNNVLYNGAGIIVDRLLMTANPRLTDPNKFDYVKVTLKGEGINPFV